MKEKMLLSQINQGQESEANHPEIQALMVRLQDLVPQELAEALYHLETKKEFPQLSLLSPYVEMDESKIYFSKGIKEEIESIYLELAKHLKVRSKGSVDLMNEVFDFLKKALSSLVNVPQFFSMN